MPLGLWMRPLIATANGATLMSGMVFMGVTSFLPVYVQGVMGRSATQAGLAITMMSLGWPLSNAVARRVFRRVDLALMGRWGGVLLSIGALFFVFMRPGGGLAVPAIGSFIIGAGMGLVTNSCTILVQSSVDWSQRGVATSSTVFSRTLGAMLGAALLGGVLNGAVQWFARRDGASLERVRHLLDRTGGEALGGADLPALQAVLHKGMALTFWVMAALAVCALVVVWRVPRRSAEAAPQPA